MPAPQHRLPPLIPSFFFALCLIALGPQALAGDWNRFCGGAAQPTVPSDLANVVGDQTLEYAVQQPASVVTCSKGYLLEKCGDHESANKIFDKCIAAGYAGAMIWKAKLLEEGTGVEQDFAKSAELLHRAAVSGDPAYGPIGKMHYASMLYLGRGVEKNEAEARKWFQAAAAEGSEEARDFLRTGYHNGARDYNTLGVGTPTAAALAKSPVEDSAGAPHAAPDASAANVALQARKLVDNSTPPAALPDAPPQSITPDPAPVASEVQGQKLERRAVLSSPGLPQASVGLVLLLLASFIAGIVRRKRQDRAAAFAAHAPQSPH